ncbi:SIMPL domain-containing protein [Seongchinamella unica]|uniref:SIMPL domain-containing protein n=1 Tax=Seongchinamella unica TaxID=2547392 RepID=A0A4R5LRX0_9GAMM|nr:SIMPL domain-containing protein [Seongchinamella unica]TDG13622.1 SIMPL domain-containing protein [Seongchinamella unica]
MNKILNPVVVALAATALLLLSLTAQADSPPPHIRVSGQAEASLAPDMATLQLTVMREAATARDALDQNSAAMAEVVAAMRAAGIAEKDLQTRDFSIQPRYTYPKPRNEHPPQLVGYTVRNSLQVKVRDLGKLGSLLDESVTLGVNEGGSVQFGNEDPSAALADARTRAVEDAIAKARTMAEAAGVKLGRVLVLSDQMHVPMPQHYRLERAMAADAVAGAVPVMAGENSYRVVVQVSYAIEQ